MNNPRIKAPRSSRLSQASINDVDTITEMILNFYNTTMSDESLSDVVANALNRMIVQTKPLESVVLTDTSSIRLRQKSTRFLFSSTIAPTDNITVNEKEMQWAEEFEALRLDYVEFCGEVVGLVEDLMNSGSIMLTQPNIESTLYDLCEHFKRALLRCLERTPSLFRKCNNRYKSQFESSVGLYLDVFNKFSKEVESFRINPETNAHIVNSAFGIGANLRADSTQRSLYQTSRALRNTITQFSSLAYCVAHLQPKDKIDDDDSSLEQSIKSTKNITVDLSHGFSKEKLLIIETGAVCLNLLLTVDDFARAVFTASRVADLPSTTQLPTVPSIYNQQKSAGTLPGLINAFSNDLSSFLTAAPAFTSPLSVACILVSRKDNKNLNLLINDFFEDLDSAAIDCIIAYAEDNGLNDILTVLEEKKKAREKRIERFVQPQNDFVLPQNATSPSYFLTLCRDSEIARQLTVIDWELYHNIGPSELFGGLWLNPKTEIKAPYATLLSQRVKRLTLWCSSIILMFSDAISRAKVIIKFVSVASHLLTLGNFSALEGVVSGLEVSLGRLNATKSYVPPPVLKQLKELKKWVNKGNAKHYRTALSKGKGIQIPSLTVLGKVLMDIDKNYPANIDIDGVSLINFKRYEVSYAAIEEFLQFKKNTFEYPSVEPLSSYLSQLNYLSENLQLYVSLIVEPLLSK